MAKINILDSSVFNLISAGEVVDRPVSVVKELVENSIDAGATHIDVEIKNGGIDMIKVVDNGCGIEKSEIRKAFMPHATSKIQSVEDLNAILTLGFRGEALASIAAVAKVTLSSKVEGEELGVTAIYEAGSLSAEYESGHGKGTSVTVENIFEKIPARRKFLKSAASEEAEIANLMTRLILANPKISFSFSGSSKKIVSTGESEKSALIAVYGNEILSNIEEVSLIMPDITIRGFIGKPSFSKHSRNYQTLVVNGRYVKNEEISYMIYLCYKDFLMSRQYPMFVLYIDLPADMVDVNVHPNKMDVKFVQPEKIKSSIKSLVSSKLNNIVALPKDISNEQKFDPTKEKIKIDFSLINNKRELREGSSRNYTLINNTADREYYEPIKSNRFQGLFKENAAAEQAASADERREEQAAYTEERPEEHIASTNARREEQLTSNNATKLSLLGKQTYADNFLGSEDILTVGTLFSTYIIVERGDVCYLIDQHAAHERILYDKLVKQINEGKLAIQNLLIPYTFEVSYEEGRLIDENIDSFKECGFEIRKDGKSYSIEAVPVIVSELSLNDFISVFLDNIGDLSRAKLIKDTLAQSACKAAVKGDRLLSLDEIRYLIEGINDLGALLCPHGRPIVVKLTRYEVDKWFKRK